MKNFRSAALIINVLLLAVFCFVKTVSADTISEKILRYRPVNVLREFLPSENASSSNEIPSTFDSVSGTVTNNVSPSVDSNLLARKKIIEQRKIAEMRKKWSLTMDYCMNNISDYDNYLYCAVQFEEQQKACAIQVTTGKNIYVDLENQLLFAVKDCKLIAFGRAITGKNTTPSPVGDFKVYIKRGPHFMQGEWFVNKALYFYRGFALHDAGWRQGINWLPSKRACCGSHGCINLPQEIVEILWKEYEIGDPVHVMKNLPENISAELWQKVSKHQFVDPFQVVSDK